MTDHPIIFSAAMAMALLAGRKTMTRRLAWKKETWAPDLASERLEDFELRGWDCQRGNDGWEIRQPSPWQKVRPGDRLWVREGWKSCGECGAVNFISDMQIRCRECDYSIQSAKGRPSIHMPRWASRLTLIIEAARVEKLWAITDADAIAEGVVTNEPREGSLCTYVPGLPETELFCEDGVSAGVCFANLWSYIHGRESWNANPEVVALTFRVVKDNIDRIKETA